MLSARDTERDWIFSLNLDSSSSAFDNAEVSFSTASSKSTTLFSTSCKNKRLDYDKVVGMDQAETEWKRKELERKDE